MSAPDPGEFYTGLVAELYRPLRSAISDPEPYARFIARYGEPALELGCGDGDPMLDLVARGLDVEGLDASPDMLDRCRQRARAAGVAVTLHQQSIQRMDLATRYNSIYLAGATFNLLPDDDTARQALERIRDHLTPEGAALIPLLVPLVAPPELVQEQIDEEGSLILVVTGASTWDDARRELRTALRYERTRPDGHTERLDREWVLHWYPKATFGALADGSGLEADAILDVDNSSGREEVFAFILRRRT